MQQLLEKYRQYWIGAAAVFMFCICYFFAFKNTINAWHLHKQLSKEQETHLSLTVAPGYAERQYQSIQKMARSYQADTVNYRTALLTKLATVADSCHVALTDIPVTSLVQEAKVLQQRVEASGDFFALLKFYYQIERQPGIGLIQTSTWTASLKSQNTESIAKLRLTLYLDNLIDY